jgi:lipoate-protein ligase A
MNVGSLPPTVVLGISGKPEKLCNMELVEEDRIPMIKRFSGGGTVVVDTGTTFVSIICNKGDVEGEPQYPRDIMSWTETVYDPVFNEICKPVHRYSCSF